MTATAAAEEFFHHHQPQSYHARGSNIPFGFPLTPIIAAGAVDRELFYIFVPAGGGRGRPGGGRGATSGSRGGGGRSGAGRRGKSMVSPADLPESTYMSVVDRSSDATFHTRRGVRMTVVN